MFLSSNFTSLTSSFFEHEIISSQSTSTDSTPHLLLSESLLSYLHHTSAYVNEQFADVLSTASTKFKEHVTKTQPSTSSPEPLTRSDHPWESLPLEISALIASYLTPSELATFAQIDKFTLMTYRQLSRESSGYWRRELTRSFAPAMLSPQIHSLSLLNYFQCNLLESQMEFRHYQSLTNHYRALYDYHQTLQQQQQTPSFLRNSFLAPTAMTAAAAATGSGIIGLVCDVAWTDSPLLSAVLSKKRYMTMSTILTQSIGDVHRFKKAIDCDRIRSFLPVRSSPSSVADPDLLKVQSNEVEFPGFVGYAVNLLKLPEALEYLRYTVFWGMFRDLMVFENRESSELYGRELDAEEMEKYWVVTLEDYSEEILGSVYPRLGVKRQRACYYERSAEEMMRRLGERVENGVISYSIARCTY
jgi:hypothetical protein